MLSCGAIIHHPSIKAAPKREAINRMDPPECSGHSHDHHADDDLGLSLRTCIDLDRVTCLNEEREGSGREVLKLHENRLTAQPSVESPQDDPELLLHIPFTEAVTVQSITIRNASDRTETASPRRIKLFADREDLDFETARELTPAQQLELLPPHHFVEGTIDYPCRPAGRFQSISHLTIFVVDNYDESGQSGTEITFVGVKGRGTNMKRKAVDTVYEAKPMPKDHKTPSSEYGATADLPRSGF
jgi:hypothetical protein